MKCSVAIHCLIFIYEAQGIAKVTSTLLAQSTGLNPVIIRNTLSALKKAGIIQVQRGTGGAKLLLKPNQITMLMIYDAMEPTGLSSLIAIHDCTERKCPVAKNIHNVLEPAYHKIEESIRNSMNSITLSSLLTEYHHLTENTHM